MAKSSKNKKAPSAKGNKQSTQPRISLFWLVFLILAVGVLSFLLCINSNRQKAAATQQLQSFKAKPFNRVRPLVKPRASPSGMSPLNIKQAYGLSGSGSGTIAIVDAFDNPYIESDLGTFSKQYGLPACTIRNGCFEKHRMSIVKTTIDKKGKRHPRTYYPRVDSGWAVEIALDVEWAHAIAPGAKVLLIEAMSNGGQDLLNAVDYARGRSDVVAVSMSWGGSEFSGEGLFEDHFTSTHGATFFASSGDGGHGVSWPAVSANVIGVGGTKVVMSGNTLSSETAWKGSGGGLSSYLSEPSYQVSFGVPGAGSKRAVPDVSYNADPAAGFSVYDSFGYSGTRGWFIVGGTSAGAPQWAALRSITPNISTTQLYTDAATPGQTKLGDIISGTNGSCGTLCTAVSGYDYVTGVGSPRGVSY